MKTFLPLLSFLLLVNLANAQCTVTGYVLQNPPCYGMCNGVAAVTVAGGGPNYTYLWTTSPAQTSATAGGLCPGIYTCNVSDGFTCFSFTTVTISSPPQLTATICADTDVSCNNMCDGSIVACANGGIPGYNYQWSPVGGNTATASNLCAGVYIVTVTDANGCTTTQRDTIHQPPATTASICAQSNVSCAGRCDGWVIACPSSIIMPEYKYFWTPVSITNTTVSNLCAGLYTVSVTNSQGCPETATAFITQPSTLTLSIQTISSTTKTANVSGGTPQYTYMWTPSFQSTPTATNLSPNTYTCCVTDENGCTTCSSAILTGIDEVSLDKIFSISPNPASCCFKIQSHLSKFNLEIFNLLGDKIYSAILNGSTSSPTEPEKEIELKDAAAGIYFVRVRDGGKTYTQKLVIE